jgi:hypothetical protein
MRAGETRMCVLPFITPSIEPNGDVRLCSAASTYAYLDQTNLGNCGAAGLSAVWENEGFRDIRRSLLTGEGLKPFCSACEYRHEGPPWVLQLHLALYGFGRAGSPEFLPVIERLAGRHEEYRALAPVLGLWVEEMPAALGGGAGWAWHLDVPAGGGRVAFAGEGRWSDVTFAAYPFDMAILGRLDGGAVRVRFRVEGVTAPGDLNVRVSFEDDGGIVLYAFPALDLGRGEASFATTALRRDAEIAPGRKASKIRVGGFGPAGTSLTVTSVDVRVGPDVFESDLDPHPRSRSDPRIDEEELSALRRDQQRLRELLLTIAPLRRITSMFVPKPARDALKKLLRRMS